jgi:menaquinol-cytochrome c reductase iron-sulfur subunit
MNHPEVLPSPGRRDFLKKAWAGFLGTLLGLIPFAAGVAFFSDPLRRKISASGLIRVTTLEALPNDDMPRKFPVLADRTDAWNKYRQVPIGAVYLQRSAEGKVKAFNVVCPHAGCFVDFLPERGIYLCPCHNSTFTLAGKVDNPASPAPRGLDTLEVEITGNEVRVKFQNFQAGRADKVPLA